MAGNPNLLSISSDFGYLWAGLDDTYAVQRFLLPGMGKDISFPVPADSRSGPQQAVSLQAAPVNAHTLGLIAGSWNLEPTGNGVYVYDDSTPRSNHVPGYMSSHGPQIDFMQWGADDTTLYGNQDWTMDAGGIAAMNVDFGGVTLTNYGGGLYLQPSITQFDRSNGLLYSYGAAFDPAKPSMVGSFDLPLTGAEGCTADSTVNRYYCVMTSPLGTTDVSAYELWVFDLNSYALVDRVSFGTTAENDPSPVTGRPWRLVRWGNAGLALLTYNGGQQYGNGGVFLIDGAAVNPNAAPDSTSGGTVDVTYAWLSSISPDATSASSGEIQVTITGTGFSPSSTACWSCNAFQLRFLPTTYVSPTQLNVTIPLTSVSTTQPLEISVFDQNANLFSSNALTFTILPASATTQVTPVNLCGLSMVWDQNSQLLYVGTADYDGAYPNSIVAVDPTNGTVVKSQSVEAVPLLLSESANGVYLYVAYEFATNLTQLTLPDLHTTLTAPLTTPQGGTWPAADMKAAPQNPHTVAATLIMPGFSPEALGGVAVYDDGTPRPNAMAGWMGDQPVAAVYDTLAWSASDTLLTSASSLGDYGGASSLYQLSVDASGLSYLGQSSATFDPAGGYLHSDFGTGLIYSEGGAVLDPNTAAIVGTYNASGLVAPDSSLNRVFFLGQTEAQAGTTSYSIESFDEKAFTPVSLLTLNNLSGIPIAMARWGSSGLAVLTSGGEPYVIANGLGMLYLIQDAQFVSSAPAAAAAQERVQQRWKRITMRAMLAQVRRSAYSRQVPHN